MRSLTSKQRDESLRIDREDTDSELRFRAPIILLLPEGHTWDTREAMLFRSSPAAPAPSTDGRSGSRAKGSTA